MFRVGVTLGLVVRPAFAQVVPLDFTVEGRAYDASGQPTTAATDFKLEIVDENTPGCVLYRELRPSIDLSAPTANARGVFSLRLGAVAPDFAAAALPALLQPGSFAGDGCTATVSAGSHRLIRVSLRPSGGVTYEALSPDTKITSAPLAQIAANAVTLRGLAPDQLLQLDATSALTQSNVASVFTTAGYARLQALLGGTSTQYVSAAPTAAVGFNAQRLTNLADPTAAQDAATKHYVDTTIGGSPIDVSSVAPMTGGGRVLTWDQTNDKWVALPPNTTPTGAAGGDLTGTYPNPTIASNAITSAKINTSNIGVNRLLITDAGSGATVGFGICALNQVYAWTATGWACANVSALAPVTSVAGKTGAVTLNAGDIDNIRSAALYDVGTAASKIPQLDASGRMPAVDGSQLTNVNAVSLQSRPVANASPAPGQVLGWNGTAWAPQTTSTGSVTSVQASTGLLGGTITTGGTLSVDVGTNASQIVQLTAAAQLPAVDGTLLTNVSSTKLQTRAVSNAMPSPGQVLGWNGVTSAWEPTPAGTTQWQSNGTNVFYNGGNVGIGTNAPSKSLTVNGDASVANNLFVGLAQMSSYTGTLFIQPTAANSPVSVYVAPSGTNTTASVNVSSSSIGGSVNTTAIVQYDNNAYVANGGTGVFALGTHNNLTQMVMVDGGAIGVGTIQPAAGLDVALTGTARSALLVPRDSTANRPVAPVNGMLRYNTSLNAMEAYVNGGWSALASASNVGSVTNVTAGFGLLGGSITTTGTLGVDVGTAANKIVQLNASAQIAPAPGTAAVPTYSFAGFTNTGLYSPAAHVLALSTNGTAALNVLADGSVGIGTGTTTQKLTVRGGGVAIDSGMPIAMNGADFNWRVGRGIAGFSRFLASGTSMDFVASGNGGEGFAFGANTTTYLELAPGGAYLAGPVGVGTGAPRAALDVFATGTGASALIVPRDSTANRPTNPVNGMFRYNTSLSTLEGYVNGAWSSLATGTGSPALTGDVTSTAGSSVTTLSQIRGQPLSIVGPSSGQYLRYNGSVWQNASIAADLPSNMITGSGAVNQLAYFSNAQAVAASGLYVSGGKLGIGTTAPTDPVQVVANEANVTLSGQNAAINLQWGGAASPGQVWNIQAVGASGNLRIMQNGSEAVTIQQSNAFVGLGNANPQYKLDVNGTVRGTSAYVNNSDRRLKHDVATLPDALASILALRGVTFLWNDPSISPRQQIGVIAQEVEAVFPQLVETDGLGIKSVAYAQLVAPLIEAVKALFTRQTDQRRDLDELTDEVGRLRGELATKSREIETLRRERDHRLDELARRLDRLERGSSRR